MATNKAPKIEKMQATKVAAEETTVETQATEVVAETVETQATEVVAETVETQATEVVAEETTVEDTNPDAGCWWTQALGK